MINSDQFFPLLRRLTDLLVIIDRFYGVQDRDATQESTATSENNALFDSRPSGVQSVSYSVLLLVHLHVTRSTNLQ